ncbi:hypothetical protein Emag_002195 [Eimeria magna]
MLVTALPESTGSLAARYPPHCIVQPFRTASVKAQRRNLSVSLPALTLPHCDCRLRCKIKGPFLPFIIACRRQQGGREVHSTSAARGRALEISAELCDGLHRLGIRELTEMQRLSLLKTLRGCNLAVAAEPGAGKTLAYLLPVLQQFLGEKGSQEVAFEPDDASLSEPFALLLLPSRELARQVMAVATALLPRAPLLLLDTTTPLHQQQRMLARFPLNLLVATPNRVLSLLRRKSQRAGANAAAASRGAPVQQAELCLERLRFLVVDEADALLRQDYMSKVTAIYQAATGKTTSNRQIPDLDAQEPQSKRDSLQLLFFTAVLTRDLHALIDSNFPDVEALSFVAGEHPPGTRGTCLTRASEHNLEKNSGKDRLSHAEHNSATVGGGVEHHVCYVAASEVSTISRDAKTKTSDDLQQTLDSALRRLRTRRSKLSDEEAHLDGERKMLALAEVLGTYMRTSEGRRAFDQPSNQAEFGAAGYPTDAHNGRDASSSGSEGGHSLNSSNVAGSLDAWGNSGFSGTTSSLVEIGDTAKTKTAPQCLVFADSHAEARFRSR